MEKATAKQQFWTLQLALFFILEIKDHAHVVLCRGSLCIGAMSGTFIKNVNIGKQVVNKTKELCTICEYIYVLAWTKKQLPLSLCLFVCIFPLSEPDFNQFKYLV